MCRQAELLTNHIAGFPDSRGTPIPEQCSHSHRLFMPEVLIEISARLRLHTHAHARARKSRPEGLGSPGRYSDSKNEANESTIQAFTDGSKSEHEFGSGTAIHMQNKLTHPMKHRLHNKCSNNQAGQMAIVKVLLAIETIKNKQ